MFEEPVRFIEDVIRNDRSVLDLLYGNYTFVNPVLAKHYGMPEVDGRRRRLGARGRCAPLRPRRPAADGRLPDPERARPAHQPGEARLLGGAPRARRDDPAAAAGRARTAARRGEAGSAAARRAGASIAQNPACAACHARFDSFGLAFEGYGPIGETRTKDLAGHPVDTQAVFPGGSQGAGFDGVQAYIREHRQKDFIDNLSRKLLAYALGRSLHALRRTR